MKNRLFFRLLILAVVTVFAVTSCKDYDDDISKLEAQISDMKKDLPVKIDAAKAELTQAMDTKIKAVNDEITALKGTLTALEGKVGALEKSTAALEGKVGELEKNSATKAELEAEKKAILAQIEAVKTEILNKTVAKEVFEAFVAKAEAELKALKEELAKKATKEELEAFKGEVAETFAGINAQLEKIMGDIKNLEKKHDALKVNLENLKGEHEKLKGKHEELAGKHDALANSYAAHIEAYNKHIEAYNKHIEAFDEHIKAFNALKGLHDKLSADHDQLKKEFKEFMGDYDGTVQDILDKITDLKNELKPRIDVLDEVLKIKDGKSETIEDIYSQLGKQLKLIEANQTEIANLKTDLQNKYDELVAVDKDLQKQINALVDSVAQHRKEIDANRTDIDKNATNIQLNKDEIAKINKYIKDVLEPRLDKIEEDIKKLQKRMDIVEDAVNLNADNILVLSSRVTDLTFIPTRGLPGEKTIKLYWNAGDYSADHVLMYRVSPASAQVGRDFTVESLNYQITTRGAINDDASEVDIEINGEPTMLEGAKGVLCIPVHLKGKKACDVFEVGKREALTLVLTVKNNPITPSSKDITKPDNGKDEVDADNVYVKSSEMVYTEYIHNDIKLAEPGLERTLNERLLNTDLDAAKAFANLPETTPEKPWNVMMYKFNKIDLNDYVLSYYVDEDGNNHFYDNLGKFGRPYTDEPKYAKPEYKFEIVAEWKGADPHWIDPQNRYTELAGDNKNILQVKEGKINSADDKKVIVKVTQVNSKCVDRQPVGYMVVKITNDPTQVWKDVTHVYDFTDIEYVIQCDTGSINPKTAYTFGENPGDVDALIDKFPIGSIKKEEFWAVSYVKKWPEILSYIVEQSSFTPADYNLATPDLAAAAKYIRIRPDYSANSFIVDVVPEAPAGEYVLTYKSTYEKGSPAVMAGPDLYITFKFKVKARQMSVQQDAPVWSPNNTLRVQYARIDNDLHYDYKSENGYRGNLTQAFIHDDGTKLITVSTAAGTEHSGNSLDKAHATCEPAYKPVFEFVQQKALLDAGFTYKTETVDGLKLVTQLMKGTQRAAHIYKDPVDLMDRIYIEYNDAGDALYNWIHETDKAKLVEVRMLTDINNSLFTLNKYELTRFNVEFERTLSTMFTMVSLDDKQTTQVVPFNFLTNTPDYKRGIFDNDKKLVSSQESWNAAGTPDHYKLAKWYNVQTQASLPTITRDGKEAIDYSKVEYSEDNKNWEPMREDLRADTHPSRYFDILWKGSSDHKTWEAVWQGDEKVSTKPIYFRVPIVNETGLGQGVDAVVFRNGKAEVRVTGYAVFKIVPRAK